LVFLLLTKDFLTSQCQIALASNAKDLMIAVGYIDATFGNIFCGIIVLIL